MIRAAPLPFAVRRTPGTVLLAGRPAASHSSRVAAAGRRSPNRTEVPMQSEMTRRSLLRRAVAAGSLAGIGGASPLLGWAAAPGPGAAREGKTEFQEGGALALARLLNRARYEDLPPLAVEYAKMIVASTLASAANGSRIDSARILRELAVERGGRPEAPVWFDGTRLPARDAARVNAVLSDAAACDDSDLRNVAHCGTALTAAGLSLAERTGATPRELLLAMVVGYEAAGRIGEARAGGRGGVHASQIVAFGAAAASGRLLGLTDEEMAHALGITAVTQGGLSIGTNSWAREYMAGNAAACGVDAALAASRGFVVNGDLLDAPRGFAGVYGGGDAGSLVREVEEWDIVRYLAVKLWPGAHPFSGTVEAAVNAAREADVRPDEVREILVSGRNRTSVGGSRRPRDLIEAIHSLPYFVASAVADRDFLLDPRHAGEDLQPRGRAAHGRGPARPLAARRQLRVELGRNRDDRHHGRGEVHEHRGRPPGLGAAGDRVERRGGQVPRPDARLRPSPGPHRGGAPHDPGSRRAGLAPGADRTACLTARVHQGGRRRPSRSPVEDR